ncbi:T9SS type A sorting domain-containing protein [Paenimyroides aestuarii]|uniref:T9SS type A sorting domain-containing protein n=1 Tax=Paenimyroides aestuarii TaxID=2968490 RepID=A0ABY5NVA4_9FLAO|nr:T9SS type A sorting domain-containing protein [Paenimyroides aestuarii]UUV22470.1 T9SS type A sorting domain-containing protein [Paenimyroides aestuarii]
MNKKLLLAATLAMCSNFLTAQVLYSQNFDNLTVGDVSTDLTGQTPGQGNWYTIYDNSSPNATPNWFQIQTEANKGKVITLQSPAPPVFGNTALQQRNIDQLINNRTQGNDVIKFEVDFYTGSQNNETIHKRVIFGIRNNNANPANSFPIVNFTLVSNTGEFLAVVNNGHSNIYTSTQEVNLGKNKQDLFLPFNTWVKCIFYADYTNKKVYFEIPSLNIVVMNDFLNLDNNPNPLNKFIPKSIMMFSDNKQLTSTNKFDNIKITALKTVPAHLLSTDNFFAEKFNIFPNPATDIVHITSMDHIVIENISIYDLNGKIIKEESYTAESDIKLNVESLQSGTYLLKLKTKHGTAIKKMIKQ